MDHPFRLNRAILGFLFFLSLIASTVFGSLAENPRQGFDGIFTGLHQGVTLSKAATAQGLSACFLESSRQVFLLGQGRPPEQIGAVKFPKNQFGQKIGQHAREFGLNPSNAGDRQKLVDILSNIINSPDKVVNGTFSGQGVGGARGPVKFLIRGADVVITTLDDVFVSVLKGGINNPSVRSALGL